jgi:hypothetical protein
MSSPSEVVQRFVNALLGGDFAAVEASFAETARFTEALSATPMFPVADNGTVAQGAKAIRAFYETAFAQMTFQLEIADRVEWGNVVVDHEIATGPPFATPFHSVWMYVVHDGVIHSMHGAHA